MTKCFQRATICAALLLIGLSNTIQAQRISTEGVDFWAAFMYNGGLADPSLQLQISGRQATEGSVRIPGTAYFQDFSVTPGVTTIVNIPSVLGYTNRFESIMNSGIHIATQDTVSVFAGNISTFTTDASVILPTASLGADYMVTSFHTFFSEMLVMATQDDTRIRINPSCTTNSGKPAGKAFEIVLQAGETYQLRAANSPNPPRFNDPRNSNNPNDFTGTLVKSLDPCKPIAVFGGNDCADIPLTEPRTQACDHLYEQTYPTHTWGKKYATVPLLGRSREIIRILASQDNTSVTIDGGDPIRINGGEHIDRIVSAPLWIEVDKPVAVTQYSPGIQFDNRIGDPFMMTLTPVEQQIDRVTFSAIAGNNTVHNVNIVTPTSNVSSMRHNGADISARFNTHPTAPGLSYARINLGISALAFDNTIEGKEGFNAFAYGFGDDDSYGFAAGGKMDNLAFDLLVRDTVCTNMPVVFRDTANFPISDLEWDFGDGNGSTISNPEHAYKIPGDYTVTLRIRTAPCKPFEEKSKRIHVKEGFENFSVSADTTICSGETLQLHANGGNIYLWTPGEGLSDSTIANPEAHPGDTTTYSVTVRQGDTGCEATVSVTVNVYPLPKAAFSYETSGLTISFQGSGSNLVNRWLWVFGDRNPNSNVQSPVHIYEQSDSFYVCLKVWNLCDSSEVCGWIQVSDSGQDSGSVGVRYNLFSKNNKFSSLYPNPSTGDIFLYFGEHANMGEKLTIRILSVAGKEMFRQVLEEDKIPPPQAYYKIGKEALSEDRKAGLYFLEILSGSRREVYRISFY